MVKLLSFVHWYRTSPFRWRNVNNAFWWFWIAKILNTRSSILPSPAKSPKRNLCKSIQSVKVQQLAIKIRDMHCHHKFSPIVNTAVIFRGYFSFLLANNYIMYSLLHLMLNLLIFYCASMDIGSYDEFDLSNETDSLDQFLKLAPPPPPPANEPSDKKEVSNDN